MHCFISLRPTPTCGIQTRLLSTSAQNTYSYTYVQLSNSYKLQARSLMHIVKIPEESYGYIFFYSGKTDFNSKFHPLPSIGRTANYEHFPFIQTSCTFNTSYFSQSACPAKTNSKLLCAPSYTVSLFHISLLSVHIIQDSSTRAQTLHSNYLLHRLSATTYGSYALHSIANQ
jgi:hypothetical protein